jgi:hypothetical protein
MLVSQLHSYVQDYRHNQPVLFIERNSAQFPMKRCRLTRPLSSHYYRIYIHICIAYLYSAFPAFKHCHLFIQFSVLKPHQYTILNALATVMLNLRHHITLNMPILVILNLGHLTTLKIPVLVMLKMHHHTTLSMPVSVKMPNVRKTSNALMAMFACSHLFRTEVFA